MFLYYAYTIFMIILYYVIVYYFIRLQYNKSIILMLYIMYICSYNPNYTPR